MRKRGVLTLVISCLALALPLQAANPRKGSATAAPRGIVGVPPHSPEYGLGDYSVTSTWTGGMAVAYQPATIFKINDGNGFYYMTAGPEDMAGGISIPSGVDIEFLAFENCDTVGGRWAMYLYDGDTEIDSFTSTAKTGCGWEYHPLSALGYPYNANEYHSLEIYVLQNPSAPTDGSDGVRGLNVYWLRKVSPAPAMQTFLDVAPGDFGYQYIEALAASGITGGCGGGNYCPNGTLTRAQMAIFISKALGLFWPR